MISFIISWFFYIFITCTSKPDWEIQFNPTPTSISTSLLGVISSIVEIINATIEREKKRDIPLMQSDRVERIPLLHERTKHDTTNFQHVKGDRLAKLVNSMPGQSSNIFIEQASLSSKTVLAPSIMFRLGDLMSSKYAVQEEQDDLWKTKSDFNEKV
uniref:Uncharacterized protein n=1 Tax=Heterorhabditis bacteriophora TaxID=37862 RepID=A0A1I7XJ50_HETBA